MLINNLLIEEFTAVGEDTVSCRAALCMFKEPGYAGVRRMNPERARQPVGLTPDDSRYSTRAFPERALPIENGRWPSFSYSEPWTVPAWTLNVVAPPAGFVAQRLEAEFMDGSGTVQFRPAVDDGRLFYFALFQHAPGDRLAFQTSGYFEYDPARAKREVSRVDRVGSGRWQGLWSAAAGPLSAAGGVIGTAAAIKTILG